MAAAAWFLAQDVPTTLHYRIEAYESGLMLRLPGEPEHRLGWDEVESLRVEGFVYSSGQPGSSDTAPFSPNLRDWRSMELELSDGEIVLLDLEPLSVEQRETVWRAIAGRAGLREAP